MFKDKHSTESKLKMSESRKNFYKNGGTHPLKGKKFSDESKLKMSISHKGKTLSDKTKQKLSRMRKGENNGFYGKTHSKETIEKIRFLNIGKKHTESTKQKIRNARKLQILPIKNTKPERFVQSILSINEIKYEIHRQDIFGYPDILINQKICVFIDGCYWHGCKIHNNEINNKHVIDKMKRDKLVNKTLKKQGYKIIRIWEHDVNNDIMKCFDKIKGELN